MYPIKIDFHYILQLWLKSNNYPKTMQKKNPEISRNIFNIGIEKYIHGFEESSWLKHCYHSGLIFLSQFELRPFTLKWSEFSPFSLNSKIMLTQIQYEKLIATKVGD